MQSCSSPGEYTVSAVNSASLIVHGQRLYVKMPRLSVRWNEMREFRRLPGTLLYYHITTQHKVILCPGQSFDPCLGFASG
jgi:hypothetical protein